MLLQGAFHGIGLLLLHEALLHSKDLLSVLDVLCVNRVESALGQREVMNSIQECGLTVETYDQVAPGCKSPTRRQYYF